MSLSVEIRLTFLSLLDCDFPAKRAKRGFLHHRSDFIAEISREILHSYLMLTAIFEGCEDASSEMPFTEMRRDS